MSKTVRVSISPVTIELLSGLVTGSASMQVDNEEDVRFYYIKDGVEVYIMLDVDAERYTEVINELKLQRNLVIECAKNKKPIDLVSEGIQEFSQDIHDLAQDIHDIETDELIGELYDGIREEKKNISAGLYNAQLLFEGLASLAKEGKGFVKDMDDSGKEKFLDLLNTTELKPYKDAIATMYKSLANIVDAVGVHAVAVNETQEKALTFFESVKARWNTTQFFGVRRSVKIQTALIKVTSVFK